MEICFGENQPLLITCKSFARAAWRVVTPPTQLEIPGQFESIHFFGFLPVSCLPPHGERLQILVADQGTVLAVCREIVVCPELLQVMQGCGLFRGIEATERELYWAGILREEFGGTSGTSLQLPPNGHDASFDSIEARLQRVTYRSVFSPEPVSRSQI